MSCRKIRSHHMFYMKRHQDGGLTFWKAARPGVYMPVSAVDKYRLEVFRGGRCVSREPFILIQSSSKYHEVCTPDFFMIGGIYSSVGDHSFDRLIHFDESFETKEEMLAKYIEYLL